MDEGAGPAGIGVIANGKSGRNSREAAAIRRAMAVLGPRARLAQWDTASSIDAVVADLLGGGCRIIVAAGGDGTVIAVAGALMRIAPPRGAALGVLPLGTFNFFARGLGLPEDPEAAARAILGARPHRIAVGEVNGQPFLNNASLGIYPAILKERETIYRSLGRYRALAHWSVVKTFLRFQRPLRLRLTADGVERCLRTPLVFVARSAYQLDRYGLTGPGAISDDRFAVFVAAGPEGRAPARGRLALLAARLVLRRVRAGVDVEMIAAREIVIVLDRPRTLVAFDGEKAEMASPLRFTIRPDALTILRPEAPDGAA